MQHKMKTIPFFDVIFIADTNALDRQAEAREAAAEVLKIDPDFSIKYFTKTVPIKDPTDRKRLISALRKAGLWKE